jgi:hypothetical protein
MCITIFVSFVHPHAGKLYIVCNNRDQDLNTKCLNLKKYDTVREQYGLELLNKWIVGLYNDNKFLNGQFVVSKTKCAILVDYRLAEDDPRRKVRDWSKTRGQFCTDYVLDKVSVDDCKKSPDQFPHTLLCWDYAKDPVCYSTDEKETAVVKTTNDIVVFVAQTGGNVDNFRKQYLTELVSNEVRDFVGKAGEYEENKSVFLNNILHILGNTTKPKDTDLLLKLGKPKEYEQHVESIRIQPIEHFRNKGELLPWCTRTSSVMFKESNLITVIGRQYSIPPNPQEIPNHIDRYDDVKFETII